jgi:hypothetical protein
MPFAEQAVPIEERTMKRSLIAGAAFAMVLGSVGLANAQPYPASSPTTRPTQRGGAPPPIRAAVRQTRKAACRHR